MTSEESVYNPYRTLVSKGEWVEGFKPDSVHDSLTASPAPKGPPLVIEPMALRQNLAGQVFTSTESPPLRSGATGGLNQPSVLTSSTEASLVKTSQWPASGPVFGASAAVSGMSSSGCCPSCGHDGASLRMFPDCFPATGVPISVSYSAGWMTSGTVSRGEFWTRAGSESPSDAVVSSLSAVLETRVVPRKYWLSAKAAASILRRAAKRGKTLPTRLEAALQALAASIAHKPGTPTS